MPKKPISTKTNTKLIQSQKIKRETLIKHGKSKQYYNVE
jgi:hypothetical protein